MRFKPSLGACAVGVAMSTLAILPMGAAAQEKLVVWWTKGFYPAEDKALIGQGLVDQAVELGRGVEVRMCLHLQ